MYKVIFLRVFVLCFVFVRCGKLCVFFLFWFPGIIYELNDFFGNVVLQDPRHIISIYEAIPGNNF